REQIRAALIALLEDGSFSNGECADFFATPPAEPASRHGPLPPWQHRRGEHRMGRRTPFATALGTPLGQVAPQIVERSAKSLGANRFPEDAHILLSGFPPFPQIRHIPVEFTGTLSGSTARNRIRALIANHRSPSDPQQTGNFGL